jgi:fructose-1,6-bisphosphatase/inositol monophosphatase family enzyme
MSFQEQRIEIENTAIAAAWAAGDLMKEALGTINDDDVESKIGSRDIVTAVDKNAQEVIRSMISTNFPRHKFLGEEDVLPGNEASASAIEVRCGYTFIFYHVHFLRSPFHARQ